MKTLLTASLVLFSGLTVSGRTAKNGGAVAGGMPGFELELFDGKTGTVSVASCEFAAPSVIRADGRTRIVWTGHPRLGGDFTATAEGVEKNGATEWTFACSGNASGLPLGRIAFPVVDVPCAERGHLLYSPYAGGGTMGWKKRVNWKDLPCGASVCSTLSPGFRFVAVLNGEDCDSQYLDVRDPASNAGRFEVCKGPAGTARLSWVHDVPLVPANATGCKLPYAASVRSYRGDWFEAASFYRDWMKTTPRYSAAKTRDLTKLREIGLWMWNRGLAETVIPPVERFQNDTGLQVALDWYWWFKEMPGTFYPDYWPPREGAEKFKADVQRLKRMGVFTQVYLNGMTWDEDAPSWKDGGLASVAMRRDGSYFSYAYNRFNPNHHLANLCGEAPKFQARIREQIAHLVDCGFDSIYLDMIGCNAYGPCFNPAHRHPMGGGTHMTDDFRTYLKGVKAGFPGVLLSTEDSGEAYADVFDSHISTHSSYERHGWIGTAPDMEFVPVFQAIWHGAVAVFGNYAIVDNVPYWDSRWPMKPWWTGHEDHLRKDFPDQFAVEFARGPAWGLQPSVHNFGLHHATNAAFAAEYRFIRATAKFYHDNRAFLFDGEMCHPGTLACARKQVAFAKVSVFDEKVDSHASTLPTVFHNVWRSPDGRVAAVLVNWTREPQKWTLNAPDVRGAGTLPPRSWQLVTDAVPVAGHSFAATSVILPPAPTETERYAAAELCRWVKEISGETWVVGGTGETRIRLGRTLAEKSYAKDLAALEGSDGYALRRRGGDCFLFGATPRGTLNAVYGFLERNSDIIWARPQFTVYTKKPSFAITVCDVLDRPKSTERNWLFTMARALETDLVWLKRNGGSFARLSPWLVSLAHKLGLATEKGGHDFPHILDKKLFKEHPEYWAEQNGVRKVTARALCLTNKDLPKVYRECLYRWIEREKPMDLAVLGIEDCYDVCTCTECQKPIRLPEGTVITKDDPQFEATRWYQFVNPLADDLKAKYGIDTAVYAYYHLAVPPKIGISKNIVPLYHPVPRGLGEGYAHSVWGERMEAYQSACPRAMRLREYYGCYGIYPVPLEYIAQDDARFCLKHGVTGFSAETPVDRNDDRYSENPEWEWDSHALTTWCIQRLWWNPDVDIEALREQFLTRAYHGAASAMRKYYDRTRDLWRASLKGRRDSGLDQSLARQCIVLTGADKELRGYLEEAEKQADHPTSRELVRRARKAFERMCGSAGRLSAANIRQKPNEADWAFAPAFADFEVFGHRQDPVPNCATVKMMHDADTLYVRFVQKNAIPGDIVSARFAGIGGAKSAMRLVRAEKAEPSWTVDMEIPLASFGAKGASHVNGVFYNRCAKKHLTLRGLPFDSPRYYPDIFLED